MTKFDDLSILKNVLHTHSLLIFMAQSQAQFVPCSPSPKKENAFLPHALKNYAGTATESPTPPVTCIKSFYGSEGLVNWETTVVMPL